MDTFRGLPDEFGELADLEEERGRAGIRRAGAFRHRRPVRPRLRPWRPLRPRFGADWPYPGDGDGEPDGPAGSEYVRWVQSTLNRILGVRLAVDGVMGRETRSAIRAFQQRAGLPGDGIVGPDTERALRAPATRQPARPTGARALGTELVGELALEQETGRSSPAYVRWIQSALNQVEGAGLAVDGIMGPRTRSAVQSFQGQRDLTVDGIVGPRTERALVLAGAPPPIDRRRPDYIRWVQSSLNRILGLQLVLDGIMGPLTRSAVRSFQTRRGLTVDGIVGPQTEQALTVAPASCSGFFAEDDNRFEPGMVAANPMLTVAEQTLRIADVMTMVAELETRRNTRAAEALAGRIPPAAAAAASLLPIVRRLSIAQLDLFRQSFPTASAGIDLAAFQDCFERFANGELRTGATGVREPDGGFYFLFAEFAFLAIDAGVDASRWTALLKPMVKTQEIFMHVYRAAPASPAAFPPPPAVSAALPALGGTPRPLDGATGFDAGNFNATGQSSAARKAALRAKYAPMGLADLKAAARDNLIRAQLMP